jgi:squalene synthase HpnC
MLYPFAWVKRHDRTTAAAAGGCMLVRRDALCAAGGIEAIRGALIDDCALARNLKTQGPIRLSLTERVRSIRAYATVQDIRRMVARSAYAQLRYSPLLLAATLAGMALIYLIPVVLALFSHGLAQALGLLAWAIVVIAVPAGAAVLPAVAAMGAFSASDRDSLHGLYPRLRLSICTQSRRLMERPHSVERERRTMTDASVFRSGKTHRDENFPVASWLIHPRHRTLILAFYEFVRCADDIADHPTLSAQEKLSLLDRLEQDLLEAGDDSAQAVALRRALAERGMSPRHAQDLLKAFRLDASKRRYRDWDDLMGYCAYSAMPVGRFVLDVHGESRSTWFASDAICAALQIINHLQDCAADYRNLDRVYIPLDALAACGLGVEALGAAKASPELRRCLAGLAERTGVILQKGDTLPNLVEDWRLALEISVIQTLAQHLTRILTRRDPLSERVHLGKLGVAGVSLFAVLKGVTRRAGLHRPTSAAQP